MENATKALVIAGSVLIAILLIAFGMRIFNSASGASKSSQSTMDATAITTFNSQFTSFSGAQSLNKIRSLTQKAISSNAVNTRQVKNNSADPTTVNITSAGTVSFEYENGYIKNIKIN